MCLVAAVAEIRCRGVPAIRRLRRVNKSHFKIVVASLSIFACGGEPAKDPSGAASTTSSASPGASSAEATPSAPAASDSNAKGAASSPTAPPAPKAEEPITSVRIYLSNKCSKPVEYCVEDGSTLNTSLGSNTSTTHTVKPGAKFRLKSGSSCGNTVFTAPASRDEVKASICEK